MEQNLLARIVTSSAVLHGKPHVRGTRIMVVQILDLLASGKTPIEITSADYYPDLTEEDIRACIAYASSMIRDDRLVITS